MKIKALGAILKLLVGLVIFVGLPLIGWGVSNLAGFFDNPIRSAYVALAAVMQVVVILKIPNVGAGRGPGTKTVHRQRLALLFLQIIPLTIIIGAPLSDRRDFLAMGDSNTLCWCGLALFLLGMTLMHWAEATLGRLFSVQVTIQEGHRLVTDGPYRFLRHPRYSGIMLFATGVSLTFRSWLGLLLAAALIAVLLWRIHDEEALLHETFGEEWRKYKRRTRRLIPFVY